MWEKASAAKKNTRQHHSPNSPVSHVSPFSLVSLVIITKRHAFKVLWLEILVSCGVFVCPKTTDMPACHADMSHQHRPCRRHRAILATQMPYQCRVGKPTWLHVGTM
jgi:hypothetical protein